MWDTNPWAKWNLSWTTRDGEPVVTETGLWYLLSKFPEAVERVSGEEYLLRLDRVYRARRSADRSFYYLSIEPHGRPAS